MIIESMQWTRVKVCMDSGPFNSRAFEWIYSQTIRLIGNQYRQPQYELWGGGGGRALLEI